MAWKASTFDHYATAETERKALENLREIYEHKEDCRFPIMEEFIHAYGVKVEETSGQVRNVKAQLRKCMLDIGCDAKDIKSVADYEEDIVEYLLQEMQKAALRETFDHGLLDIFPSLREATKK
jgi:hypothetical protein